MMPALVPYCPGWPQKAAGFIAELHALIGPACVAVHHVGSTSVPGLPARPVIDLIPEVASHAHLGDARPALENAGFEWMGAFGLPGRRYLRRDGADGWRQVHVHCYEQGSAEIARHLAFRDLLRRDAEARDTYGTRKAACLAAHPEDHRAYGECKSALIDNLERIALEGAAE